MFQILIGSIILSLIHAVIPNHWLPLIALSKAEKWSKSQSVLYTFLAGLSHTLSTVLIGVFVGLAGVKLSITYGSFTKIAAPLILFSIGLIYLVVDMRSAGHHHHHHAENISDGKVKNKSNKALIISLCIAMFLTPCFEIEAYYFQASRAGWPGIFLVSGVYLITTLVVMLTLVYLGIKGMQRINFHFLEHHEKTVTGIVMMALGILAYFA